MSAHMLPTGGDELSFSPKPRADHAQTEPHPDRPGRLLFQAQDGRPKADGLLIDLAEHRATLNSRELILTLTEFRLLACLTSHPGHLFDYCSLAELVLGYCCSKEEARTILRVHVMNLRRKLGDDSQSPRYIHCVRGVGYRFGDESRG